MYAIGDLHVMKTYTGGAPYSSAPVETLSTPQPQPPWAPGHIDITEGWACFVDESDSGWGFYSPRYGGALAGFHGAPAGNASDDPCGYYAPTASIDLTYDAAFSYDFALVVGSTADVRAYAYAAHAAAAAAAPAYADFAVESQRLEFVVAAGRRVRAPAADGLLRVASAPRASLHAVRLVGPPVPWAAAAAPAVEVLMVAAGGCGGAPPTARASVTFVRHGERVFGDAALAPLKAAAARRFGGGEDGGGGGGGGGGGSGCGGGGGGALLLPPPADGYGGALAAGAGGPARASNATLPLACSAAAPAPLRFDLASVAGYEGLMLQMALDVEADAPFEVSVARVAFVGGAAL